MNGRVLATVNKKMAPRDFSIYLFIHLLLQVVIANGNSTSVIDTTPSTGTIEMATSVIANASTSTNMHMTSDLSGSIQPSQTAMASDMLSMNNSDINTESSVNNVMTSFYSNNMTSHVSDATGNMSTVPTVEASETAALNASVNNSIESTPTITIDSTQIDLDASLSISSSVVLPTAQANDSDVMDSIMPTNVSSLPDVTSVGIAGDSNFSTIVSPMLSTEPMDMATSTVQLSPTASQPEMTSTVTQPSTTKEPTTPAPVKTTTASSTAPRPGNKEHAVFRVTGKVEIINCTESIAKKLEDQFKNIPGFYRVRVTKEPEKCSTTSRRKRAADDNVVEFVIDLLASKVNNVNETVLRDAVTLAVNTLVKYGFIGNTSDKGWIDDVAALSLKDICDAEDYCPQGFKCGKVPSDGQCYSICDSGQFGDGVLCKNDGECVVEYDYSGGFITKCRCTSKEYFMYEGDNCETEKMTWKLIIAIAAGVAGAIIIILVFVICVVCMRTKKTEKASSELSYSPINELTMKDYRDRSSRKYDYMQSDPSMIHDQAYDNKAYDMPDDNRDMLHRESVSNGQSQQWDPSRSASTYAKLNTTFDDSSFQKNIKRPRVTSGTGPAGHDGMTGF